MRLVNPIFVTDETGRVVKCQSLAKANRIRRCNAGLGGPGPKSHPTKKQTPGRLRHYRYDRDGNSTLEKPTPRWKMIWKFLAHKVGRDVL